MRRLFRLVRSIAIALSLVLMLVAAGVWVGGDRVCGRWHTQDARPFEFYPATDLVDVPPDERWWSHWQFQWCGGRVGVVGFRLPFFVEGVREGQSYDSCFVIGASGVVSLAAAPPGRAFTHWEFAGVRHVRRPAEMQISRYRTVVAYDGVWFLDWPAWMPMLAGAVAPMIALRAWTRRRMRTATGRCAACGYDLRATPDKCPECGQVPSSR